MERAHGSRGNRFYTEEEEDEDGEMEGTRYGRGISLIPICSSAPSSSSSVVLNWVDASEQFAPAEIAADPAIPTPAKGIEREQMFEKVVTPSDVGKLNRLVIPKQHAEKYFPLDASTHDKGLLLNFEDRNGKPWRFRYSYWNSSQSYVMTKGWSRFVKEKRLDAGDTVSFGRGTGETARHRLFIDWKRRPDPHLNHSASLRFPYQQHSSSPSSSTHPHPYLSFTRSASAPWAAGRLFIPNAATPSSPSNYFYFRSGAPLSLSPLNTPPMVLESVPVSQGASPKRVRLFGVNLEQPHEAAEENTRLQLGSPANKTSSAASSSSSSTREAKNSKNSPPLDIDMR